jgi:hypothetical protein
VDQDRLESENRLEGETSIDDLREAWAKHAKHSSRRVADDGARRWKEVRRPAGAMFLSLDRLNWYSPDGIHLVDDLGVTRAIDKFPPALWKILLREASSGGTKGSLAPKQASPPSKAKGLASTSSSKFPEAAARQKKEPGYLSPTPATLERCLQSNVVEDTMCELCGQHQDTIHGRI